MSQPVKFPLRISYPAAWPYAAPRSPQDGLQAEIKGDRVIITYFDEAEFRACIRAHWLAHYAQLGTKPVKLEVAQKELI